MRKINGQFWVSFFLLIITGMTLAQDIGVTNVRISKIFYLSKKELRS
jgi:hypothetical protein